MFYDEKMRLRRGRGGALVSTCGVAVGESEESKSEAGVRELGREGHSSRGMRGWRRSWRAGAVARDFLKIAGSPRSLLVPVVDFISRTHSLRRSKPAHHRNAVAKSRAGPAKAVGRFGVD